MSRNAPADIEKQLAAARRHLEQLTGQREIYVRAAENRHWTELDSAVGSGIRRKPDHKAQRVRLNRYDREAKVFADHLEAEKKVAMLERRLAAARAETDRVPLTAEEMQGKQIAKWRGGWYKIARVNRATLSLVVDTNPSSGFELVERIPIGEVVDVR